jgi:type VI protein secretion system component VasK
MGDPFLNYFALFLLLFVVVVLFYGIIAIHDIPHMIAEKRDHPHQDAIYAAGWVSLFTLHALWPFLWIWAMAYRPERGWGFSHGRRVEAAAQEKASELDDLRQRVAELENKLREHWAEQSRPKGTSPRKSSPKEGPQKESRPKEQTPKPGGE